MVVSPKIRNERKAISPLSWAISPLDIFSLLNIQSPLQRVLFFDLDALICWCVFGLDLWLVF